MCLKKKVLVENEDILTNDHEVAETLNTFFNNAVRVLEIQDNMMIDIDNEEDFDIIILNISNMDT